MNDLPPPAPERSALTGFAVNPLDRLANHRDDADFVQNLRGDASARSFVLVMDRPVLKQTAQGLDPLFTLDAAGALGGVHECALLGRTAERPFFATRLADEAVTMVGEADPGSFFDKRGMTIPGRDDLVVMDMRTIAAQGLLEPALVGALGQAKSLFHWHATHGFCAKCGAATHVAAAGWRRECPACRAQHFPRTDPVVIMLAVDGEFCLMGRQARFPAGMYSCLAGFIESGETVEDAVRREIQEEAGIKTGRVVYVASQPWPFPASLMIGCLARATSTEIVVDRNELEDARWFSRAEARQMLAREHPDALAAPQPLAIAHHILRAWAIDGENP